MKKLFFLLIMMLGLNVAFAQKDVTTFLGIPVDGYKSEMKQKLIRKGFTLKYAGTKYEHLEGEFNGKDVNLFIGTQNNKVWRIMVCDAKNISESQIKIRFNNLVRQFEKNKRYTSFDYKQTIDEDVDISYEMSIHKKEFTANFFQKPDEEKIDTLEMTLRAREKMLEKYSADQLENMTDEIQQEMLKQLLLVAYEAATKKHIWFSIAESGYNEYYIVLYYDNEYNHADGEDL